MRVLCMVCLSCASFAAAIGAEEHARASNLPASLVVVCSGGSTPGGEHGIHSGARLSESGTLYDGTSDVGRIGLFAGLCFAWSSLGATIDATDSYSLNQYGLELQSGIFMPIVRSGDFMAAVDLGVNLGYGLAHGKIISSRAGGAESDSGSYLLADVFLRPYFWGMDQGGRRGMYLTIGYRIQAVSLPDSSFDHHLKLYGAYVSLGFGVFF